MTYDPIFIKIITVTLKKKSKYLIKIDQSFSTLQDLKTRLKIQYATNVSCITTYDFFELEDSISMKEIFNLYLNSNCDRNFDFLYAFDKCFCDLYAFSLEDGFSAMVEQWKNDAFGLIMLVDQDKNNKRKIGFESGFEPKKKNNIRIFESNLEKEISGNICEFDNKTDISQIKNALGKNKDLIGTNVICRNNYDLIGNKENIENEASLIRHIDSKKNIHPNIKKDKLTNTKVDSFNEKTFEKCINKNYKDESKKENICKKLKKSNALIVNNGNIESNSSLTKTTNNLTRDNDDIQNNRNMLKNTEISLTNGNYKKNNNHFLKTSETINFNNDISENEKSCLLKKSDCLNINSNGSEKIEINHNAETLTNKDFITKQTKEEIKNQNNLDLNNQKEQNLNKRYNCKSNLDKISSVNEDDALKDDLIFPKSTLKTEFEKIANIVTTNKNQKTRNKKDCKNVVLFDDSPKKELDKNISMISNPSLSIEEKNIFVDDRKIKNKSFESEKFLIATDQKSNEKTMTMSAISKQEDQEILKKDDLSNNKSDSVIIETNDILVDEIKNSIKEENECNGNSLLKKNFKTVLNDSVVQNKNEDNLVINKIIESKYNSKKNFNCVSIRTNEIIKNFKDIKENVLPKTIVNEVEKTDCNELKSDFTKIQTSEMHQTNEKNKDIKNFNSEKIPAKMISNENKKILDKNQKNVKLKKQTKKIRKNEKNEIKNNFTEEANQNDSSITQKNKLKDNDDKNNNDLHIAKQQNKKFFYDKSLEIPETLQETKIKYDAKNKKLYGSDEKTKGSKSNLSSFADQNLLKIIDLNNENNFEDTKKTFEVTVNFKSEDIKSKNVSQDSKLEKFDLNNVSEKNDSNLIFLKRDAESVSSKNKQPNIYEMQNSDDLDYVNRNSNKNHFKKNINEEKMSLQIKSNKNIDKDVKSRNKITETFNNLDSIKYGISEIPKNNDIGLEKEFLHANIDLKSFPEINTILPSKKYEKNIESKQNNEKKQFSNLPFKKIVLPRAKPKNNKDFEDDMIKPFKAKKKNDFIDL